MWASCLALLLVFGPAVIPAMPIPEDFSCLNLANGDYPNPKEDCSQHYFSCVGGSTYVRICPQEGLKYDAASKACLEPEFVQACGGNPTIPPTSTMAPPKNTTVFEVDCSMKQDGLYADGREQCSHFFVACVGGWAYPLGCPEPTLRFDTISAKCLDPEWVEACGGAATTVIPTEPTSPWPQIPFDCASRPDGDYENPEEKCSEFFISCVNGVSMTRRCAGGHLRFDIESGRCWEADQVKACGGTPTIPTQPTTVHGGVSTVFDVDCTNLADGFYPDGRQGQACSKFFVGCVAGMAEPFECPPNTDTRYDPETGLCLHPDFVQICGGTPTTTTSTTPGPITELPDIRMDCSNKPDGDYENPEDGCSQFYISCVAGKDYLRWCTGNLRFDPMSGRCVEGAFVKACGGEPTPVPELPPSEPAKTMARGVDCSTLPDGFYADQEEQPNEKLGCSPHFVGCSGGIASVQTCPSHTNTRYDIVSGACLPPFEVEACKA